MKYIVMECHLSYAVVLDEEGRFLKVANKNYKVGQTVTDITKMQIPASEGKTKKVNKWMYSLGAMAACLVLMVTALMQTPLLPYASVYMSINPQIRIDVNRRDIVVDIDGINSDGEDLILGYDFRKKELDEVMDDMLERAVGMGYLHEGGKISIVLDAENEQWITSHSETITGKVTEKIKSDMSVTIEVSGRKEHDDKIVIPVYPNSDYGESDYDDPMDSDYGNSGYGESDYIDSDYGNSGYSGYSSPTDHDDTDHDSTDYAGSDYISDDTADDDDSSDYEESKYDEYDQSDYTAQENDSDISDYDDD